MSTSPKFANALDKAFETTESNLRSFSGIGMANNMPNSQNSVASSRIDHLFILDEDANL